MVLDKARQIIQKLDPNIEVTIAKESTEYGVLKYLLLFSYNNSEIHWEIRIRNNENFIENKLEDEIKRNFAYFSSLKEDEEEMENHPDPAQRWLQGESGTPSEHSNQETKDKRERGSRDFWLNQIMKEAIIILEKLENNGNFIAQHVLETQEAGEKETCLISITDLKNPNLEWTMPVIPTSKYFNNHFASELKDYYFKTKAKPDIES